MHVEIFIGASQAQIKSNYWFNVQTFIREDDSDAQMTYSIPN